MSNLEREMLREFIKIAKKQGYEPISGQGINNRMVLEGNLYFQLGDLRVDTSSHHVIIEVETAGGVTNLVKYWYCLQRQNQIISKPISKPIVLLHIFKTSSPNDYGSHLLLWDYLWPRMANDLGDRMQARKFKVGWVNELPDALNYFGKAILGE